MSRYTLIEQKAKVMGRFQCVVELAGVAECPGGGIGRDGLPGSTWSERGKERLSGGLSGGGRVISERHLLLSTITVIGVSW